MCKRKAIKKEKTQQRSSAIENAQPCANTAGRRDSRKRVGFDRIIFVFIYFLKILFVGMPLILQKTSKLLHQHN
jgi:hypothetical protein